MSEDFEAAQSLSSQVEQARVRAVVAAADAGAALSGAAGAEHAAREHAKRAEAAALEISDVSQEAAEAKASATVAVEAQGAAVTAKEAAEAAAATSATAAETAKQEAIQDATIKYGGIPGRVSSLESDVSQQFQKFESTVIYRGSLNSGSDINNNKTPGIYAVTSTPIAQSILNLPEPTPGNLVTFSRGVGVVSQLYFAHTGGLFARSVSTTTNQFGAWVQLDQRGRLIPDGTNLDTFIDLGLFRVASSSSTATMPNRPPVPAAPAILENLTHSGTRSTMQRWTCMNGGGVWVRTYYLGAWSSWQKLGGQGTGGIDVTTGHYGTPNMARIEDFKEAFPLVSTGGKGAVIFRWDHGLTNFKSDILPLHTQYSIPCIIAMNSRNWEKPENSGMSKTDAKALATAGLIQWGNHGADGNATGTHKDESTAEGLWDQIVNGRLELEADLGIPIWQYMVPGTSGGQGGLGTVPNLDVLSSTYAGSIILAHHATTTGYFPNSAHRKLNGRVKQGQSHWNIEQRTVAEVKAQIDSAVTNKTALCLMGHPRELNRGTGYYTTAMLAEIFAYIDSKIQAGELANISPLQSLHAKL